MSTDFKKYNLDTPEKDLVEAFQKIPLNDPDPKFQPTTISYLSNLLSSKYQKKILDSNKSLVIATWVLAIATIILVIVTFLIK